MRSKLLRNLHARYFARESLSTIRDCQPGPVAFQRARTSGGRRREIEVRGAALFGRPRGRSSLLAMALPKISGSTSRAGRARRNISSVHSGLSGSVRVFLNFRLAFIAAYLSPVGFAQTDDVHPGFPRRVHQHIHSRFDPPESQVPLLAVVTPRVLPDDRAEPIEIRCALQRNAMDRNVARILRRIAGNVHAFIVYTLNAAP